MRRATRNVRKSHDTEYYFYPRSPCGERRPGFKGYGCFTGYFYPRSPCGERPHRKKHYCLWRSISIHALLAESDYYFACPFLQKYYFYPRSPCGERPSKLAQTSLIEYISIHALLAESDVTVLGIQHKVGISIHALLAESDHLCVCVIELIQNFYPRSPCGERQSSRCGWKQVIYYFYPRSPCGERRVTVLGIQHRVGISIHALLAESDWFSYL